MIDWEERARQSMVVARDIHGPEAQDVLLSGIICALLASNERAARIEAMLERIEENVKQIRRHPS